MDLVGRLSNHRVTALYQSLTRRDWHKARPKRSAVVWSDGRRPFGSVRDAIIEVLAEAGSEVRVKDIQAGVERLLDGPVSGTSVKAYLRRGCQREMPLIEYCGRKGYRLLP
jgi:hypothetical protein